ncbi:hypothetical protein SBF1_8830004 [Candidatus Desulfosporosinus infrequens]|uniref:Uncharacterized protein n=1 Tax=Candidatus Desulfosporosinus infrequens TaxID=2043169 RepID=A0A2U3LW63_9FIRM|nr:hypothetical protein SBF1_8830004 [Candidatus Desulfosporosinus infrequens]
MITEHKNIGYILPIVRADVCCEIGKDQDDVKGFDVLFYHVSEKML